MAQEPRRTDDAQSRNRVIIGIALIVISALVYWSSSSTIDYATQMKTPMFDALVTVPINIMDALEIQSFEAAMNLMNILRYGSIAVGVVGAILALAPFLSAQKSGGINN